MNIDQSRRTIKVRARRQRAAVFAAITALLVAPFVALQSGPALAAISEFYDFNTPGSLSSDFNTTGSGIVQSSTGGIANSGSMSASGSANAIYASKTSYSLGPVGSTYVFETFLQSVGNNGYSGVGFTSSSPATTSGGGVYRPSDAIGISVHGGGYVFHNGASEINGSWDSDPPTGVTSVKLATIGDLLNNGSPTDWYKVVFVIVRDTSTTFDTRVEIWSSDADGVLLRPDEADAIFEVRDITNNTLTNAPKIHSYFNFSGDRVRFFDNFSVNLSGGATVVSEGAPVVLTTSIDTARDEVAVFGQSLSEGAASLVEQGFVFGTTSAPVVQSDTKVVVNAGLGTFTAEAPSLPSGQHYVRAFAKNSNNLVSYGVSLSFQVASSGSGSGSGSGASSSSQAPTAFVVLVSPEPSTAVPRSRVLSLFGTNFDTVTEVFVGGRKVEMRKKSAFQIEIVIPSSMSGLVDLELKSPLNNVLSPKHFNLGALGTSSVRGTELSVSGFEHNSRKLTKAMKKRINLWLNQNPRMSTLTCTGFTSLPKRATDVVLSTRRGNSVCDFAKGKNPNLEIVIQPGVEDPRPGSKIRRALLVLSP